MRRLSTRTDFTFGFAAAICACWMIAAFFSDHFETGGKRSDIYSWISLRPYRNPEACIGVRLRMATSLFIWPVGNAQTLFSGISYSPYRNPEAGGCADVRPSASGFFFGFWFCPLFLFWSVFALAGNAQTFDSWDLIQSVPEPEAWERGLASGSFFGFCFCAAVFLVLQ